MPLTLKRPRHESDFARSIKNVFKSLYSTEKAPSRATYSRSRPDARTTGRRIHPITTLPHELIAYIFLLASEDDIMSPVVLSHVCRAWRSRALHTPSLWRRIVLDARLSMWTQRLYRAKACTLDITLAPRDGPLGEGFLHAHAVAQFLHVVLPYVHRWRSLEIRFDAYAPYLWNSALSSCCARYPPVYALTLQELTLVYPGNDDMTEFTLFNGVAPKLCKATLCGIRLTWLPSLFQSLTVLDYTHHGFTFGHEAAIEVLCMLQVSSRLQELRLAFPWRRDGVSPIHTPTTRPVRLPYLSTFIVSIKGPEIPSALLLLLPALSIPAVHTLKLLSRYPFRRPTMFPRLREASKALPRFPSLEHLYVEHGWLDTHFLFPLIQSLPRLQHLALQGLRVTGPFLLGLVEVLRARQPRRGAPLQLKALELIRCDNLNAGDIAIAVKRRSPAEVPCMAALYICECKGVDLGLLRRLKGSATIEEAFVSDSALANLM